jgi:hypothetical protein
MAIINWETKEPIDGMMGLARSAGFYNQSASLD